MPDLFGVGEGLINNIIDKINLKSRMKYKIILTGGYANFLKKISKKMYCWIKI